MYIAKVDVESAFRITPIYRLQIDHCWVFVGGSQYFIDAILPMGFLIFECFSTALEWVAMVILGVTAMVRDIDDFLMMSNSEDKCKRDLMAFTNPCQESGVPLAPDKTVGRSTAIPFLGIILDTVNYEARLPDDKFVKARELILTFLGKQKVTLKELQQLIVFLKDFYVQLYNLVDHFSIFISA